MTTNGQTKLTYGFTESEMQRATTVSGAINGSYTYNYDEESGLLANRIVQLEDKGARTENIVYDGHGMLQENGNESFKTTYSYDEYDRLTTKSIILGTAKRQELEYTYRSEADYQTERIESI